MNGKETVDPDDGQNGEFPLVSPEPDDAQNGDFPLLSTGKAGQHNIRIGGQGNVTLKMYFLLKNDI